MVTIRVGAIDRSKLAALKIDPTNEDWFEVFDETGVSTGEFDAQLPDFLLKIMKYYPALSLNIKEIKKAMGLLTTNQVFPKEYERFAPYLSHCSFIFDPYLAKIMAEGLIEICSSGYNVLISALLGNMYQVKCTSVFRAKDDDKIEMVAFDPETKKVIAIRKEKLEIASREHIDIYKIDYEQYVADYEKFKIVDEKQIVKIEDSITEPTLLFELKDDKKYISEFAYNDESKAMFVVIMPKKQRVIQEEKRLPIFDCSNYDEWSKLFFLTVDGSEVIRVELSNQNGKTAHKTAYLKLKVSAENGEIDSIKVGLMPLAQYLKNCKEPIFWALEG